MVLESAEKDWLALSVVSGVGTQTLQKLSEIFVDLLPGDEIEVNFSRGGSKLTKTVKLARLGDIYLNERR